MKRVMSVLVLMLIGVAAAYGGDDAAPPSVGKLIYGGDHHTLCFNDAFVQIVNRESNVHVAEKLEEVKLHDVKLFEHPMVVMAGTGDFTLTNDEVNYLRQYLLRGGFLLASSKCQDKAWDAAFRREIKRVLPDSDIAPFPGAGGHALMKVLFDVKEAQTVRAYEQPLWAATVAGRVAVLYSPVGLNDSASMGPDCCCCGGNEVRNARWINANALVYAMTR